MRGRFAWIWLALLVGGMARAEEIAPSDLPGRATVALTAQEGELYYFGTGSIISPLGYVLTSTTVIPPDAKDIEVVSPGHFRVPGTLVHADEKTELSIVRIDPPEGGPLPYFAIRRSKTATLGEVVMTVANSIQGAGRVGELSVSLGLLSGRYTLTRDLSEQPTWVGEVLETTAASNPASDGGPLLDGSGRLLGVLSLNTSDARWLGVAVPIDVMLPDLTARLAEDLKERGIEAEPVQVVAEKGEALFPDWEARVEPLRSATAKLAPSVVALRVDRRRDDRRFQARMPRNPTGPARLVAEMLKRPDATVTGVVVGSDGWIATSYFNIAGDLNALTAILHDGRELEAEVVGWDQERDLAMLKVEADGLPAVTFGPGSLGQAVGVLGRSPTPDSLTLTQGIVSAKGRNLTGTLQFDAKANVGNSGGPLIALDGTCLGIVGGIAPNSTHGQNSGIAFALGAEELLPLLEDLKTGTRTQRRPRPVLGIIIAPGAVDQVGVLVGRVDAESGAAEAGIQSGDAIVRIDGVPMEGQTELVQYIRSKNIGDQVKVVLLRRGVELEVEVTLGEASS